LQSLYNPDNLPGAGSSAYALWLQNLLIFALIPLGYVLALLTNYHRGDPWRSPELLSVVVVSFAAWTAWRLNRKGYYQAGSLILILTASLVIIGLAYERRDLTLLHYLLLAESVGVLFLSRRLLIESTLLVILLTLVVLPLAVPQWSMSDLVVHSLGFVLFGLAMIGLIVHYYRTVEHERQLRLIDSEAKYRHLVEHSPMGLLVYVDNKIVYANSPALKIIGASSLRDILGMRPESLIRPGQSDVLQLRAQNLESSVPIAPIQEQIVRLDGALRDVEVVLFRAPFEGRSSVQVLLRDITPQRTTESALYQSEARMRALLSAIPDLMFRFSRFGVFLDYKPTEWNLYAQPEEFLGQHVRDVLPLPLADRVSEAINSALATGETQIFTYQLVGIAGITDYEARMVPSGADEVTAIVRNITHAKRAEEALHRRDVILGVLANASERLLQSASLDSVLPDVLAQLGTAVPDSRVFIFENERDAEGQLSMLRRGEWVAPGIRDHISSAARFAYDDGFSRWAEQLGQGQILSGMVRDCPPQERARLEAYDVVSFVVVPIFTGSEWWGFLGIDNCASQHEWMPIEVEALRNLAGTLGAAIVRQRAEITGREQRQVIEALRDTAEVIGSSLQLGEVLGHILASLAKVVEHDAANIVLFDGKRAHLARSVGYGSEVTEDHIVELVAASPCVQQIQAHAPMLVSDMHEFGAPVARSDLMGWVRSHLSVPIELGADVIGMLTIDARRPNCYGVAHIERMQTFAAQSATAIRNAQLYDQVQRHARELETLRAMMLKIGPVLDLDPLLKTLVSDMLRLLRADRGGIYLYAPETEILHWRVGVGFDDVDPGFTVARGHGLAGGVLVTNDVEIVNDFSQWQGQRLSTWNYDGLSAIAVPITYQDQAIGVFLAASEQARRTFGEHDARLMRLFANQTAVAIQTAQLFQAEREQRRLSEAMRDLAAALGNALEMDEVFSRMAETVHELIDYDFISIMLVQDGLSRSMFHRGLETLGPEVHEWLSTTRFTGDTYPPLRIIVEQGEPYMIEDVGNLAWGWESVVGEGWSGSYMAVPMQIENRTVGIVNLATHVEKAYTPTQAGWLRAFANQAAIAMDNTRLYAELSRHAEEMAVLHRGTTFLFTSLSSSAELKDVGAQIAQTIADEFGGVGCAVFLIDRDTGQYVRLGRAGSDHLRVATADRLNHGSALSEAVETGATVYMPELVPTRSRLSGSKALTRSELVIPLKTATGLVGVLDLQSAEPHAFSDQDRSILGAFAERVAVVLENRQLYDEIRRYTDELEQRVKARTVDLSVRNAVAQTLSSSLDVSEMLNGVLKTAVEQLSVMGGAIYLLAADAETLSLAAYYGISEDDLALVTGILPGKPDLSPIEQPSGDVDITQETGVSAVMSVPIWRKDHIQGIITLVNDQPRPWRTEETHMLDAIGRQIGVALANAALYAEAVRGEAHVRTILRSVADGLLVFDPAGSLILMNPAAEELFAFYPARFGGPQDAARRLMAWFQSTRPDTPGPVNVEFALPVEPLVGEGGMHEQCLLEHCAGASRQNPAWPCWLQVMWRRDSSMPACPVISRLPQRSIQAHSADVRDSDGADLGTVIVLHDVTYFRELDELKGRFVSTVSHELRTPLSAILLQVSTLLKYYTRFEDEERQEMLADIEQQAHVLRELIEDILELSRFDSKRTTLQKRWIDLSELYRSVLSTLRPVSDDKALTIVLDGFEEGCFVEGDVHQLERVFRNLVSNAIKYTPERGAITIDLGRVDGEVQLAVTDTGIGIAPDEQPYVFDRFFRARTATRIASGTGLGLSIVKEIVDLHGGRVELSSELGVGSTFTVTIPVGQPVGAGAPGISSPTLS
jgi:PAS domain S-box-containing protein